MIGVGIDVIEHASKIAVRHVHAGAIAQISAVPLGLAQQIDQLLRCWLDVIDRTVCDLIAIA